jgi:thiamine-monophosphate kinase
MSSTPSEFQIIKRFFEGVGEPDTDIVLLGIGDDCSVVNVPEGKSLCFSLDTMVEGRHFPKGAPSEKIATRAMAAALSDLAAMGASPSFFTLSMTIPAVTLAWLEGFSRGLKYMAGAYHLSLVGGDTTSGHLCVGIQVHGFVDRAKELRRSGAKEGDLLVVTGTLGDAGAALGLLGSEVLSESESYLLERYYRPTPRFKESALMNQYANACIDISDGLLADARHIAEASACGLRIDMEALPISRQLLEVAGDKAPELALSAGDDYELLFSVSEAAWAKFLEQHSDSLFTVIGQVVAEEQGVSVSRFGKEVKVEKEGYKHFE